MADLSVVSLKRTGIDRRTGKVLRGFDHCRQSLAVIFTTRYWTRVMRLDFGSLLYDLLDRPGNSETMAQVFQAIYKAISDWEPGYRVTKLRLYRAGNDGEFAFDIEGTFYPLGHLGDYSVSEPGNTTIPVSVGR